MPNKILYVFAPAKTNDKVRDSEYPEGSIELIGSDASAPVIFALFPKETHDMYGYAVEEEYKSADPKKVPLLTQIWNEESAARKLNNFFKTGKGSPAVIFEVEIEIEEVKDEMTKPEELEKISFTKEQIINIRKAHGLINSKTKHIYDLNVPQEFIDKYNAAYEKANNPSIKQDSKKSPQVVQADKKQEDPDKLMLKGFIAMCDLYLKGGFFGKPFSHAKQVGELITSLQIEFNSDTPSLNIILEKVVSFQKTIIQDILDKKGTITSQGKKENSAALAEIMLDKLSVRFMQKQANAPLPKIIAAAVAKIESGVKAAIGDPAQYLAVVGGKPTNAQVINAVEILHRNSLGDFGLADHVPRPN